MKEMSHPHGGGDGGQCVPRLIAWEVTRSCMLACKHCRAAAQPGPYSGELSTEECYKLLDNIASFAKPIIILTGGEPMLREDIYDIAAYAHGLGLPVVMAPCGMLLNDESAAKIVKSGIRRISISLDGATKEAHDSFRGVEGAFEGALRGIEAAKRAGLDFQINTTVTKANLDQLGDMITLTRKLGASVFNPFLLVPTGRGKALAEQELSPGQYEETLRWLTDQQAAGEIPIRVTCAPHYQRILRQRGMSPGPHAVKGCMGGQSFAFISHRGKVQICGFLDIECGDVRAEGLDFRKIWETSEVFLQMRDVDGYHGRCGVCEFRRVCGGCRARAFAISGDYLGEEPFCTYKPKAMPTQAAQAPPGELDELDKKVLSIIQADFPVVERPFEALAETVGAPAALVMEKTAVMRQQGIIRRLGAVFDSARLGYVSTLVAASVAPEQLDGVAALVSELPGVTHNYRRENVYNLWFTLSAPSQERLDGILDDLRRKAPGAEFHSLPASAVYKIKVDFDLAGSGSSTSAKPTAARKGVDMDEKGKALVRLLQEDLPIVEQPFAVVAAEAGVSEQEVIDQVEQWRKAGVIRRFGAVVRHQRLGFSANGMAVFGVDDGKIDEAAKVASARREVSHCYRRPALPGFPYELFAMIHGRGEDAVRAVAAEIAEEAGVGEYDVLFSTKEYKKVSMRYFMDD